MYVSDPEKYFKRAIETGAVLVSETQLREWGDIAGYIADIDGHIIAFVKKLL